ncbi:uncharacterized protein LOC124886593 [Capsicum annuum]|uniref:uncharacterized protein LOC124886593 n=1 Tax=Capsicum annuum TaxID=4072 RepID=UPI001FB1448D|nr:uncharacterized protein LOC124886593 [Capsicum annuum]
MDSDSGATHHIATNTAVLSKCYKIGVSEKNKVHLPTNAKVDISHTGEAHIFKDGTDLHSGRVKEIKENGGLCVASNTSIDEPPGVVSDLPNDTVLPPIQDAEDERWIEAMKLEIKALKDNNTWKVVDLSQGDLDEEVYMKMPNDFKKEGPHKVCSLIKSLYGLKQASRPLKIKLTTTLINAGIEVLRSGKGVLLNQRKYNLKLISEAGLAGAKLVITPLKSNAKLTSVEFDRATSATGDVILKMLHIIRLVGKLMYAIITRLDTSYVVQTLSQFMQQPKKSYLEDVSRAVGYLKGTIGQGIWLKTQITAKLIWWCNSDWLHALTQGDHILGM